METIFEKQSPTSASLNVAIAENDYQPEVEKKLKEYAKTARVKGFRPGHVPMGYIKNLYGKSVKVDVVIKQVSDAVNNYIKENKLKVVGDPIPSEASMNIDWDTQNEFKFDYEVGLASDFEVNLESFKSIEQLSIEADETQIQKAIEDIKVKYGNSTEPEEAAIGDIVFGVLSQESTDFNSKIGIPTDKVAAKQQKLFVGLEKGSSVTFDIKSIFETEKELGFALGKSNEEVAALSGDFKFEIEKITRVEPAELNPELFEKVLGIDSVTTMEDFKAELKKIIEENYSRETEYLLEYEVEKALYENVKIDLPDAFLKKWLLQVNEGKFSEEEIEKDYDAFAKGLKLDLIKSEVAEKNDLKIEYDDVLEVVKAEISNYFGSQMSMKGMEDFIDQMARKQLNENKGENFRNYYNRAYGKKVVGFAKSKIPTAAKTVSVDEFNKLASEIYDAK